MNKSSSGIGWGIGAGVIYVGFVVFILGLVMYASVQDVNLVEESYYEEGLAYQDRIDRWQRATLLEGGLTIKQEIANQAIVIAVGDPAHASKITGEIRLMRPSNSRLDQVRTLRFDASGRQVINTAGLVRGVWRIEVDWNMDGLGYYSESRIVIP